MWERLAAFAIENPPGATLLLLAGSIFFAAAGIYGVRFVKTVRGKNGNGNGNGDDLADYSRDLQGLGPPRPPRQRGDPFIAAGGGTIPAGRLRLVTTEAFDATVKGINRDVDLVRSEGREVLERVVTVEQTCARTEVAVAALRQESKDDMRAQTIEITRVLSVQILGAFEALGKETDEKIAAALSGGRQTS